MGDFLLTTASGNRYRENMPLCEYIKRHPKIPQYMQMYIDDIIREIHAGNLVGNETYPYKIKKRLAEESAGLIMISLSKYKYSETEAAEMVEMILKAGSRQMLAYKNSDGLTALDVAKQHNNRQLVQLLVRAEKSMAERNADGSKN